MRVNSATGWLESVRQVSSPNCDERPVGTAIDLLVIHGISLPPREFGGPWIDALFTCTLDPSAHPYFQEIAAFQVSAHVLIRRDGEIVQYVPFQLRAWHAGQSVFEGRSRCNDFSIGIELEGCDDVPYEEAQYASLIAVTRSILAAFPAITQKHIVGHSEIAPGRKTDPGPAFDWQRYHAALTK